MAHDTWRKPDPELVDRFHEAVAGIEGVEVRRMFGFPAAFITGHMTAGLHQDIVMVRLPDAERQERIADGCALRTDARPSDARVRRPPS